MTAKAPAHPAPANKGMPRTIRRRLEAGAKKKTAVAKANGRASGGPTTFEEAAAVAVVACRADGGRVAQGPWGGMTFTLDPAAVPAVQAAAAAAAAAAVAGLPAGAGAHAVALAAPDADARVAARVPKQKLSVRQRPAEAARAGAGSRAVRREGHRLFQPAGGQ